MTVMPHGLGTRLITLNINLMKRLIGIIIAVILSVLSLFTLFGCNSIGSNIDEDECSGDYNITEGTQEYRGFTVDSVYHSDSNGDIHFNYYVPDSYDGSKPYALYLSLCGYGGYYFQGIGVNLRQESFVFEAQKYNAEMIIVAPQLTDWGNTSANQAIALTEYFLNAYNIDATKVYANGYSGGGETLSLIMEKCPELFTAVLHVSSIWDGELQPLANSRTPVYFVIGESDEYYGSARISRTYEMLCSFYKAQGLTDEQINDLAVLDIKSASYFTERGVTNQHGGALFAFDSEIMGWLFNH